MQNLLYSIRAIKPVNPPFTFDNLPRGFDKGVWTSEKQSTQELSKMQSRGFSVSAMVSNREHAGGNK